MGFAPANSPKLVALAVIDGVPFFGGSVAAPAVQSVLLDSLKYLGLKPDLNAPLTPSKPMPGLEFAPVKKAATVPSVIGLPLAEATQTLTKAGFKVATEGQGSAVVDQIPNGEASVEAGGTVLLYLGNDAGAQTLAGWWEDEDEDVAAMQSLGTASPYRQVH